MSVDLEDPDRTFRQLKTVRDSGRINMLDAPGVQRVAFDLDCHHLVGVLEDLDNGEYGQLVMKDFSDWLQENE